MSSNLSKRIITGLLGGSALIALLVTQGYWGAVAFGLILSLGCSWELAALLFPDQKALRIALILWVSATWILSFLVDLMHLGWPWIVVMQLVGWSVFLVTTRVPTLEAGEAALEHRFADWLKLSFAWFYGGMIPLIVPELGSFGSHSEWVFVALVPVWAGDTAAYFMGKRFGRHKLFPIVSPGKTWEGAIAGGLAAVAVVVALGATGWVGLSLTEAIVLGILIAVFSQIGDLCESLFKRAMHAKDSGSILPGHGGFLDRFDGVLFALPWIILFLRR